jgi:RNA polymerase sigma factor (sigma-70 family)
MPTPIQTTAQRPAEATAFLFKHGTSATDIERTVWASFRNSNRKALDYIFEKYVRLLYVYGGKIVKDQALVEDCIQDLFVELWNKRQILGDTDNIKFYLFKSLRRRIIRRLSVDQRLQAGHFKEDHQYDKEVEFPIEFNIIQEQVDHDQEMLLKKALASLSERQREAIYLKFYEKLPYHQIAGVMNLDIRSAYNLVGKAIDSLRKAVRSIYHL